MILDPPPDGSSPIETFRSSRWRSRAIAAVSTEILAIRALYARAAAISAFLVRTASEPTAKRSWIAALAPFASFFRSARLDRRR